MLNQMTQHINLKFDHLTPYCSSFTKILLKAKLLKQENLSMGGAAFGEQLPRLSIHQYLDIVSELKSKLCPRFYRYVQEPRSLPTKTSFGDVDLLVTEHQHVSEDMPRHIGATSFKVNGNIISLLYRGFQVDLIKILHDRIDLGRFHSEYGDLGMILGMLSRNLGFKFGIKGLTIKLESYKIELSHDLSNILQFLGLDQSVWERGFQTEAAIFKWITSCKYFRPSFFSRTHEKLSEDTQKQQLESSSFEQPIVWNHESRLRFNKRPMFQNWIQFVATLPSNAERVDTSLVRSNAIDFFNKRQEYSGIERQLLLTRRVKTKFNGMLCRQWTDFSVEGRQLGDLIMAFKHQNSIEDMDSMTPLCIRQKFVDFFAHYNSNTRSFIRH